MKNHFLYSYSGNKRNECQRLYKLMNFDNIDTIIETNCGSSALSYYILLLDFIFLSKHDCLPLMLCHPLQQHILLPYPIHVQM